MLQELAVGEDGSDTLAYNGEEHFPELVRDKGKHKRIADALADSIIKHSQIISGWPPTEAYRRHFLEILAETESPSSPPERSRA